MQAVLLCALFLSACTPGAAPLPAHPGAPAHSGAPQREGAQVRTGGGWLPAPDKRLPRAPGRLAGDLRRVTEALKVSLDGWAEGGALSWARRPPRDVVLQSLYHQRIVRRMSKHPVLARRVVSRSEERLGRVSRVLARAGAKLRSLVTPVSPSFEFRTQRPEPAGDLSRYYHGAQRRFGVHWSVLASINFVETKFGRVRSQSSAGAQGPMQFLPATWDAYGMGGNIQDPHDAIFGAANYLRASGAPAHLRRALFAYNNADSYVDAVMIYARLMRMRPRRFLMLYNQQVFVITTRGDVRITGPGF